MMATMWPCAKCGVQEEGLEEGDVCDSCYPDLLRSEGASKERAMIAAWLMENASGLHLMQSGTRPSREVKLLSELAGQIKRGAHNK